MSRIDDQKIKLWCRKEVSDQNLKTLFLATNVQYEPKVVSGAIFTTTWGIFQLIVIPFEFCAPKCHFRKWGKWPPDGIFLVVFIDAIMCERETKVVATNKLKTMRRHPGIPPEGKRVPVQRLESSNSKQWGIFSLFQRVSQNEIVPVSGPKL